MAGGRDHSKFIIQRYDNFISGANTKGNFLLAINTFLCGAIIVNYSKLVEFISCPSATIYLDILLTVLVTLSICATFFVLRAVYPFIVSGNSSKDGYHSHIFFNSVAEFENAKTFCESFDTLTDEFIDHDMAQQAYHLACGLKRKYKFLEWSMMFVYAELAILFLILITILIF